jgi:hypothetical protein
MINAKTPKLGVLPEYVLVPVRTASESHCHLFVEGFATAIKIK